MIRPWGSICRDMLDHELVGNPRYFYAWCWLILNAEYQTRNRDVGGVLTVVERGQVAHALSFMAKACFMTVKEFRTFLAKLEARQMVALSTTKQGKVTTVVTICNYDRYQAQPASEGKVGARSGQGRGNNYNKGTLTQETPTDTYHQETTVVGVAPPPAASAKAKSPRKTGERLPDDWVLPEEWKQWALATFGTTEKAVAHQAMMFRNYWTAKAGKDATKRDWERTWQTWCHKAREYTEKRVHKNGHANGAAIAFTGTRSDIAEWNARQQAALERQLKDLEFQP